MKNLLAGAVAAQPNEHSRRPEIAKLALRGQIVALEPQPQNAKKDVANLQHDAAITLKPIGWTFESTFQVAGAAEGSKRVFCG